MQHIVSITTQGQLTVPASVRRKLGITHSTKAIVEQRGGSFVVTPKRDFWSLPGSLAKGVSLTDEELEHATSLFEKNWAMNEKTG
ncbi:MAG: AbrB/MazE/SpoVT family DNA-binding domain-containing protein [Pseudomonadales bacterium]|nr:AbrB/MazE/SpoVT family DNA-binding domain-containing protein [Candidatus Woesebacteria bacterium]MCB9801990.1 AbrB/MazE/SpoVT family DNA-binding domain-containing protein [Pseudomonadales bacterium]